MKNQTTLFASMLLLTVGILAGCSSGATGTAQQPANQANTSTTSIANSSNTVNTVSPTANTSSSGNSSTSTTSQSETSSVASSAASSSTTTSSNNQIIKQYLAFAKEGKIASIPFAEQSNMDAVYRTWGQKSETSAGAGMYTTYTAEHAAFGFNKGEQIFDLRSYNPQLKSITQNDITHTLGTPGAIRYTSDSYIYMYPAGPDYQLLWVFQKDSKGKPMSYVDHVSVFWPEGTINLMAQTNPAPSIVINTPPGKVGSLFTFSIQNSPINYHLVELEWIPDHGTSIIDTTAQAIENARTGNEIPGFTISQDGQTMSFAYSTSLKGQTGHARVIFQATSGVAMIGYSPEIALK